MFQLLKIKFIQIRHLHLQQYGRKVSGDRVIDHLYTSAQQHPLSAVTSTWANIHVNISCIYLRIRPEPAASSVHSCRSPGFLRSWFPAGCDRDPEWWLWWTGCPPAAVLSHRQMTLGEFKDNWCEREQFDSNNNTHTHTLSSYLCVSWLLLLSFKPPSPLKSFYQLSQNVANLMMMDVCRTWLIICFEIWTFFLSHEVFCAVNTTFTHDQTHTPAAA